MPLSRGLLVACAQIALLVPFPAYASDDTQLWTGIFLGGPVRGKLGVWVEGQLRITDGASRLGQRKLRIGAGWEPNRDLSLYGGYAVFRNLPEDGAASVEHRVWQQGIATIRETPRIRLFSRTRLEQRWRENRTGTSLRVREMIRANVPLGQPEAPSLVVSSEVFGELQDTSWGARSGLDQIRNFAGVSLPLRSKMALEFGYMNQAPARAEPGGSERHRHGDASRSILTHLPLSKTGFCMTRRELMTAAAISAASAAVLPTLASAAGPASDAQRSPQEALTRLKAGNARFVADKPVANDLSRARRLALAQGQQPFATLVGCSDSRVGPEQLFGAGLGELFIVRNAGNNVDMAGMGSIEYSVAVLGVPLVVVLGHEKCGAVAAAVDIVQKDIRLPGSIGRMVEPIVPAVLAAQRAGGAGDLVSRAITENVRRVVERLQKYSEPLILEPQKQGKLMIVGAVYSLATGQVRWL